MTHYDQGPTEWGPLDEGPREPLSMIEPTDAGAPTLVVAPLVPEDSPPSRVWDAIARALRRDGIIRS